MSIIIFIINNDVWFVGNSCFGIGVGEVDIYGYDFYFFGFDCLVKDWLENVIYIDFWLKYIGMSLGIFYIIFEVSFMRFLFCYFVLF